jgi:diphthine synthase
MLYMIGLGLNDEKDVSVNGLEAIKKCEFIFLENYTSRLNVSIARLEEYYGKKVILADRDMVEKKADEILRHAKEHDAAFLVVGDVFSATTHSDLFLRAREKGVKIKVIHNTSIMTAVGRVGLELYKYGKTTSMPYFEPGFRPETPYQVIKENMEKGLHTLLLLDIKPDRHMSVYESLKQLLEIEGLRKEGVITKDTKAIGCARLGSEDFLIRYGRIEELMKIDFGKPLHCMIIPGKLHFIEEEMLKGWV